jgi:hypothetical protein
LGEDIDALLEGIADEAADEEEEKEEPDIS